MSVYKETYMGAALLATTSAAFIRSSWASYTALAIGIMVSDPEGMDGSATKWRDTDKLNELKTKMEELKTHLKEKGTWEGGASESFDGAHATYVKSLEQFTTANIGAGDAVSAHGGFTKAGAVAVSSIAAFMAVVAAAKYVAQMSRLGGPWLYVAYAAYLLWEKVGGQATLAITKKMLMRHGIALGALGFIMQQAGSMSESAGKLFPMADRVPSSLSGGDLFGGAGTQFPFPELQYKEGMGLTEKMDTPAPGDLYNT
ncbi:WXG100 family type VII secretion target [Nonomuraea basaltis]|uniref:WXG100 family type VII secretion target n=1 Tax=Nonomuraea basaltis TaxID=2495887 RepID=UPI00110C46A7|nr:WXG100 family type VII secretion target [Nonomuraea basaltis]TMR96082.1 WXG100 family type VII secretion target [Nonomuraea basaltis]